MWFFWAIALIPIIVGAILFWRDEEVVWWEWLIGSGVALLTAGSMQMCAFWGMTKDNETWSGQVVRVAHYPSWVEEYEEDHSETYKDSDGTEHTRHWTTTEHTSHSEKWKASRDFGAYNDEPTIDFSSYEEMRIGFGGRVENVGTQSTDHFNGYRSSGDNRIYGTHNARGIVYPVTTIRHFENRIKAAPTVFSFSKVPTNIAVFPWPENSDPRRSGRLLGTASALIDVYKWDCLNTSLGPRKRVNLIMVGFAGRPAEYAQWQQAAWIGGKKNDLVICFGGGSRTTPATWAYVFGWTENELVKKNLQTLLLEHPINDELLSQVSDEVTRNYKIKDWHKFDYISIQPPTWSYWVYFLVLGITQGGLYWFFHVNDASKEGTGFRSFRRSRSW